MFDKIKPLPNSIFIPKIVPLVYDDTLSYYEFVAKLMVKLEEIVNTLNTLGVKVDALEEAVRQLQEIISGFDDRLTAVEGDVTNIKADILRINNIIDSINGSIETINTAISNLQADNVTIKNNITSINSAISDIRDDLEDLADVTTDIASLQTSVSNLDTRVTNLENATFGDIELSPVPKNFCCNMLMFDKLDYEIVKPEPYDTGLDDTVKIEYGCFRFRGNNTYNQTFLRLKNFCPKLANNEAVTLAIIFADTYSEYGQCIDTTFGALLSGISCIIGVTNEICIGGAKLVPNTDGDFQSYHLELYVNAQDGSATYIANSRFYLEWCAILGGVGYLTQGRGSADAVRPYINAYNSGIPGGAITQADFDALSNRVSTAENDIDTIENNIAGFTYNEYVTDFNTLLNYYNGLNSGLTDCRNDIDAQATQIDALEDKTDIETWDDWHDVFDEGQITPYSKIIAFHMQKVGKLVTFEIAGCNFHNDSNHPVSTFCLGTIRSGLRSKLAPYGNIPATFTGVSCNTDGTYDGIEVSGNGSSTNYSPLVIEPTGIATAQLFGNSGTNPYTWNAHGDNPAYSLCVNLDMPYNTSGVSKNAFVIRGCYMTN